MQTGWAKCETKPGVYDFAWLDEVVNDALAQGVQPWLEVSYGNRITGAQVVTLWLKDTMPSDSNNKTLVDFTLHASRFADPVYADLRTGEVYSFPKANWSRSGDGVVLGQVPIYDSPILIAEKAVLGMDTAAATEAAELIFQSGFEGTCEIVPLGASQHDVIGKDTPLRDKNDWVEDMEKQAGVKTFRFDYTGGDISQRFVRIVPEPGNPTNRVIWFWLNDSWKADGGVVKARVQADIYGVKEGLKEFYQSVRVFLPEDCNPMKLYTSKELVAFVKSQGKKLQIYWDDFRLWKNRQPTDSQPSPPNR